MQRRPRTQTPATSTHDASPAKAAVNRRFLIGATALGGVGALAVLNPTSGLQSASSIQATPGALDSNLRVSTSGWETDFSKHSVPLSEIRSGGPPRDGIPPIDNPQYVSIAEADEWLEATEPVIALAYGDPVEARAYPLQIMTWHEIVNDELAGEPLAVTFCPLCNTAIVFHRRLDPDGPVYDFGTTGNLRHSDLVMWDRQTESWWQQMNGEAIVGELTGRVLTQVPAQIIGWEAFKEAYPDGDVLSRDTGFNRSYGRNPYVGYDDIGSSPFLFDGEPDERLLPMERVVALTIGSASVAYPFRYLADERVINDRLDDQEIVVFYAPGARSALDASEIATSEDVGQAGVFLRTVDGQLLTFQPADNDHFTDEETSTTWDITGHALSGPLEGQTLDALPHTVVFWFAWGAFEPDTRIWSPDGS